MSAAITSFIPLLHRLADAAGEAIRPYFRKTGHENKADNTPVTLADKGAEQAIRAILEKERPKDGVWGEEFGASNMGAEFSWVIDPIDGTKSFIRGMPVFTTLIALLHNGKPVLGLIDQPILRERWVGGEGHPTTLNGKPVKTRKDIALKDAVLNSCTPDMFKNEREQKQKNLSKACRYALWGGDAYTYAVLVSGFVDLAVDAEMKLHDYAALVPIVIAAGGKISDWNGKPLGLNSDGTVLAAGDAALWEAALPYLKN